MTLPAGTSTRLLRASSAARSSRRWHVLRSYASEASSAGRQEYDVVIVGGGPAGLALATALGGLQSDGV